MASAGGTYQWIRRLRPLKTSRMRLESLDGEATSRLLRGTGDVDRPRASLMAGVRFGAMCTTGQHAQSDASPPVEAWYLSLNRRRLRFLAGVSRYLLVPRK